MASSGTQRKLTAILCADVAGYSRLMGADEEATIETLTAYRKVFLSSIASHNGRVVDAKGDAILAEFASVVDAVNSAVEIQRELAERNAELPGDRRMDFRIGINLGDVVVQDDVIYGDGINVAARLEALAEPGGICISRSAYDQVKNKLKLEYEYLGEQQVKNIAEPVRAYRVLSLPGAAAHRVVGAKKKLAVRWRKVGVAIVVVVLLAGAGLLGWNDYRERTTEAALAAFRENTALAAFRESPALPLPEKPSIAVLAFDNLSGDKEQEFFSDGISENITTMLARLPGMFVIARNSAFIYKGKPVDVRQVGRELGVRYVLEGSMQKSAGRVRITAQLVDAVTGRHLWADRYDRKLQELFTVQDEITLKIVKALQLKLSRGAQALITHSTDNLEAWEASVKALRHWWRFTRVDNLQARKLAERALELDPNFALMYVYIGWTHWFEARLKWVAPSKSYEKAMAMANRGLRLNPLIGLGYSLRGRIYNDYFRNYDKAIAENERGIELEPNNPNMHLDYAGRLIGVGRAEEAVASMERAKRLHPYHPPIYFFNAGVANYFSGRYEAAAAEYEKYNKAQVKGTALRGDVLLVAAYAAAGKEQMAKAQAAQILKEDSRFSANEFASKAFGYYKNPRDLEKVIADLRKSGLPE